MEPWCTYSLAKLPPLLFLEGRWKRRNENPWRGKIISISIWPNFRQPVQHVLDFSWSHGFIKQQGVYEMIAYCTTKNKNMKIYQSCWQDLTKVIIHSYFSFFFFSPFFNFSFWEREREKRRDGTGKRKKFGKKMRLKKKLWERMSHGIYLILSDASRPSNHLTQLKASSQGKKKL